MTVDEQVAVALLYGTVVVTLLVALVIAQIGRR